MSQLTTACARLCGPAALGLLLALAGCGGMGGDDPSLAVNPASGCVDDSKDCIERRQAALKGMLADPNRGWVRAPESPQSFATGVKLFAYRSKKAEMTCSELAHGRQETQTHAQNLKPGSVAGMNDSRLSQVKDMSGQVSKELSREFDRVCRSPTEAKKGFEARAPKL